jgi:hypothetical protein
LRRRCEIKRFRDFLAYPFSMIYLFSGVAPSIFRFEIDKKIPSQCLEAASFSIHFSGNECLDHIALHIEI